MFSPCPLLFSFIFISILSSLACLNDKSSSTFLPSFQTKILYELLISPCYILCPSCPPWLDHGNIWHRIHITTLLIMQFLPQTLISFMTYTVQIICVVWLISCKHCNLACCLWSTDFEHSSANLGLCSSSSYWTRLSLAEILIFFWIFSQYYLCSAII
jgi:hypothetical protein